MNVVFVAAARKTIRRAERGTVGMIVKETTVPTANPTVIYSEKIFRKHLVKKTKNRSNLR